MILSLVEMLIRSFKLKAKLKSNTLHHDFGVTWPVQLNKGQLELDFHTGVNSLRGFN